MEFLYEHPAGLGYCMFIIGLIVDWRLYLQ